jgi:hypothetical protein
VNKVTDTELAYIAGFIDGEGSIHINKRKHQVKNYNSYIGYSAYLDIGNTYKPIMEWLNIITKNTSKIFEKKPKGNRKTAYAIRLSMSNSQKLIEKILPFLKVKREQALIFLEFCKYSKDKEKREVCFQAMKKKNKRGIF